MTLSTSTAVVLHCAHDCSWTGAEGSVLELGRWPVLWSCDCCGATVLDCTCFTLLRTGERVRPCPTHGWSTR